MAHVTHNSGTNNDWYTPPHIIECVKETFGGAIDLDPASSEIANKVVGAKRFFTEEIDGLSMEWSSESVYLNPPYARGWVKKFMDKMVSELDSGRMQEGIALINNGTETGWFQNAASKCSAVCFPRGRIRYLTADLSSSNGPLQGQAILYFGDNREVFLSSFERIGVTF
jgi:phage N-6-adenine-methyltransferase